MITVDTMHMQRVTTEQMVSAGGNCVLALEGN